MLDAYPIPTACKYCGSPVIYASNATIYGREYGNGRCYRCTGCDAYVGVHSGTKIPLGMLANAKLRRLKTIAHDQFDRSWRGDKRLSRDKAYGRLATLLGIPHSQCHMGWFDEDMLLRVIEITKNDDWYKGVPA